MTTTAEAILEVLRSPNVRDSNGETANVVDVGDAAVRRLWLIANAITPVGSLDGVDATGGRVSSLTEAVMGIAAGLVQVATAIDRLASAVED